MRREIAHPLTAFEIRKQFKELVKEAGEKGNQFFFAIRLKADDRLIGFLQLPWIEWSNGVAILRLGMAEAEDLRQYGREVLGLALVFIFNELNLYRVTAPVTEYNTEYAALYEQAGFTLEVRQREMCYRAGRRWDMLLYGCLAEDWGRIEKEAA
ncbi:MAG: GNAT family N-acetyltransferase [Chloroflexi bacterium]|nr:GNAT family N-acetyltransferase [Chloroflexota bacterium]